jgi:HAE1 family hydrophobic/amphiphilic exporter-1
VSRKKKVLLVAVPALLVVGVAVGGYFLYRGWWSRLPEPPPTIIVEATYPGATAQVVADTVAAPIEQQVSGVEDML